MQAVQAVTELAETHVYKLVVATADLVVTRLVPAVLAVLEQAVLQQAVTVQAGALTVAQLLVLL